MKRKTLFLGILLALGMGCQIEEPSGKTKKEWGGLTKHKQVCHYEVELKEVETFENTTGEKGLRYKQESPTYKANVEVRTQGSNPGDGVTVTIESEGGCAEYRGKLNDYGDFRAPRAPAFVPELAEEKLGFEWIQQAGAIVLEVGEFKVETGHEFLSGYCASGSEEEPESLYEGGSSRPCEKYRMNYEEEVWEKQQEDGSWKGVEDK